MKIFTGCCVANINKNMETANDAGAKKVQSFQDPPLFSAKLELPEIR